jgi:hypothetical protein
MIPPGIFFECCTRLSNKFELSQPFHREGWLYATNGSILVRSRIDPQHVGNLNTGRRLPNPMSVIESSDGLAGQSVPLPEADEFMPCLECDGPGNERCQHCHGNGSVLAGYSVPIHDNPQIRLAVHYVGMLRRHGVDTIKVYGSFNGKSLPVRFEGPDFEGCLMPLMITDEDDDEDDDEEQDSFDDDDEEGGEA